MIIIILIAIICILLIGITFAWFRFSAMSKNTNSLSTGKLEIRLDEYDGKVINLTNTYPLTDASGIKTKAYEFSLVNNTETRLMYDIRLVLDQEAIEKCGCENKILDDSVIRYQLIRNDSYLNIDFLKNKDNWILDTARLGAFSTNDYSLRLWLYETAGNEYMGKHFHAKIEAEVIEDV